MSFPDSFVKVPFTRRWINRELITQISYREPSAGQPEPKMTIYFAPDDFIVINGADSIAYMRAALGLKDTPERVK
jgi:hypothetical protein